MLMFNTIMKWCIQCLRLVMSWFVRSSAVIKPNLHHDLTHSNHSYLHHNTYKYNYTVIINDAFKYWSRPLGTLGTYGLISGELNMQHNDIHWSTKRRTVMLVITNWAWKYCDIDWAPHGTCIYPL